MIQHWLNGEKVIDFDYTDPKWTFEVELLKVRGAKLADRGANLYLQDHGDPVWYRNIKIRSIGAEENIQHTVDVVPATVPVNILKNEKAYLENGKKRAK